MSDQNETKECAYVVEDSDVNRRVLVHLLRKMGYEVAEYENGMKAWEALNASDAQVPVAIFSDIMMPELDGLSLLKKLREESAYKTVPFVLLTALSDKDSIVKAKSLLVDGYLLKPISYDKLRKKLIDLFPDKTFPKLAV
ncbi:MAG: response regulator [Bdellovibrionales bacterium]|nr:response regulator [Bdellovibrionales bacterium]